MNYYVYLHIKADTGEPFYVGKGIKSRASKIKDRSQFWNNIVSKHGFDIIKLEINLSEQEAFEREKYWIQRIGRRDLGLGPLVNLTDGGEGTNKSEETIKKISLAKIGSTPWNKGKKTGPLSKEHKEKIGKSGIGRVVSEESRLKASESNKGQKRSIETRKKNSLAKQNIGRLCINLENGIYYNTIKDMAIANNIPLSTLKHQLKKNINKKLKLI